MTVLLYSVCTGLSALSQTVIDFSIYRFVTGLGVGGVFGLAVALIADSLPDRSRPHALGLLQSLSAVGNVTAGAIAIFVGYLETTSIKPGSAWRYMFVIGALPAFLCVFIQMRHNSECGRGCRFSDRHSLGAGSPGQPRCGHRPYLRDQRPRATTTPCLSGIVPGGGPQMGERIPASEADGLSGPPSTDESCR